MLDDLFSRPTDPLGRRMVTFVCTGNICRSPLAEKLLRARLDDAPGSDVAVASAGLRAVVGGSMEPQPTAIALRFDADPAHKGTQISADLMKASTLVLTMTADQRAKVSQEYPFAMKRTFTLVEFLRILREVPGQVPLPDEAASRTLFDTVIDASRFRGMITLRPNDDIDDPYRRSLETHERVGTQIEALVRELAGVLRR